MCFCSSRVKYVCYVPISPPLNVMEPRYIPEITPPTLLALSSASSGVHNLTGGSLSMHASIAPLPRSAHTHTHTPRTRASSQGAPFAASCGMAPCKDFVGVFRYTSTVSYKDRLLKMQDWRSFRLSDSPSSLLSASHYTRVNHLLENSP